MTTEQKIHRADGSPSTSRARLRALSDVIVICCAVGVGQLVCTVGHSPAGRLNYTAVSVTLAALWIALVTMGRGVPRITARTTTEYLTLAAATLQVFGVIAIGSLLLHADVAFGYLTFALLLGLGALLCTRWMWHHAGRTGPAWKSATSRNPL